MLKLFVLQLYINKLILPLLYISLGVLLSHVIHHTTSDQTDPIPVTLDPSLYLATVDEITHEKTSLLYKDTLPAGKTEKC